MALISGCTSNNNATVPPLTGGTGQNVDHALYITTSSNISGDTKVQCNTVRIGPDGLQN